MYRLNISYKHFYFTSNEIWLYESDPNAPSTCCEPGGKQWQHSIRGWRNSPHPPTVAYQIAHRPCDLLWPGSHLVSGLWRDRFTTAADCTRCKPNARIAWWCHQNGNIFRIIGFVWGIHRSSVKSPHKDQWYGVLMLSLNCAWTNG